MSFFHCFYRDFGVLFPVSLRMHIYLTATLVKTSGGLKGQWFPYKSQFAAGNITLLTSKDHIGLGGRLQNLTISSPSHLSLESLNDQLKNPAEKQSHSKIPSLKKNILVRPTESKPHPKKNLDLLKRPTEQIESI